MTYTEAVTLITTIVTAIATAATAYFMWLQVRKVPAVQISPRDPVTNSGRYFSVSVFNPFETPIFIEAFFVEAGGFNNIALIGEEHTGSLLAMKLPIDVEMASKSILTRNVWIGSKGKALSSFKYELWWKAEGRSGQRLKAKGRVTDYGFLR